MANRPQKGSAAAAKHGVSDASIYKLEGQVRRHGRIRSQEAEDAGRREHEIETASWRNAPAVETDPSRLPGRLLCSN